MNRRNMYTSLVTIAEKCFIRFGVPKFLYSIGKYKEDAVCIEWDFARNEAFVYQVVNKKRQKLTRFVSPLLAVSSFIDRTYEAFLEAREGYENALLTMFEATSNEVENTLGALSDCLEEEDY